MANSIAQSSNFLLFIFSGQLQLILYNRRITPMIFKQKKSVI